MNCFAGPLKGLNRILLPDENPCAPDGAFQENDHPRDRDGRFSSGGGKDGQRSDAWNSPGRQEARRDKVEDAMREIANGKAEATVSGLRNDLERYGGTNDVTIIRGDSKKGLIHIKERHGIASIAPVLEAVANGKITRFVDGNKTVHIDKDGYRAVLSLQEHGKQKTWLLTGYDIVGGKKNITGDSGKVSARHASTHTGPILSRPDMGAVSSFAQRIERMMDQVNDGPFSGTFAGLNRISLPDAEGWS